MTTLAASLLRVSWLNFEPWSQSFLQSKPISGIDCLSYSGQHHCSFCIVSIGVRRIFHKIAKDASKPAVSWLKFEPKVSNFPFDNSQFLAIINHATRKIHFSFYKRILYEIFIGINEEFIKVWEELCVSA